MWLLLQLGLERGYFPEPTKNIFVGPTPANCPRLSDILQKFNFNFQDSHCYIGGFISTNAAKAEWLQPQINKWVQSIPIFAGAACQYLQAAFAGLTKSL